MFLFASYLQRHCRCIDTNIRIRQIGYQSLNIVEKFFGLFIWYCFKYFHVIRSSNRSVSLLTLVVPDHFFYHFSIHSVIKHTIKNSLIPRKSRSPSTIEKFRRQDAEDSQLKQCTTWILVIWPRWPRPTDNNRDNYTVRTIIAWRHGARGLASLITNEPRHIFMKCHIR